MIKGVKVGMVRVWFGYDESICILVKCLEDFFWFGRIGV